MTAEKGNTIDTNAQGAIQPMGNNLLDLLLVSDRALQLEVNTLESQLAQLQQIKQQLNMARETENLAEIEFSEPSGIPTADAILKLLQSAQDNTGDTEHRVEAKPNQAVEEAIQAVEEVPNESADLDGDLGTDRDLWQAINSI